jgi:hypothetical protein
MYTFSPNTIIESAKVNANFTALSDGTADTTTNSLQTFRDESISNHVVSGGVWSGDNYGATLYASMTSMVAVIHGRRVSVAAVTARAFTASKDNYVDVDYNGTITYQTATIGAASPALAANSIRIAKILTGATTIAAASSVHQSNIGNGTTLWYNTDSLGNPVYPQSHEYKLNYTYVANGSVNTTTQGNIANTSWAFIMPTGGGWIDMAASLSWSLNAAPAIGMGMGFLIDGSSTVGVIDTPWNITNEWSNANHIQRVSVLANIYLTAGSHTVVTKWGYSTATTNIDYPAVCYKVYKA